MIIRSACNYTGSFPESDGDRIYNTCTVFNPSGDILGKYRKVSKILNDHEVGMVPRERMYLYIYGALVQFGCYQHRHDDE